MTIEDIRSALGNFSGNFAPDATNLAKVKSVDEGQCTCVLVDDDGQEIFDVRLRPVVGPNRGIVQIPEVGSFVLAIRVEGSEGWMVVACEKVLKLVLIANEIVFNNGALGGIVNVRSMVQWMNNVYDDLQTLKASLSTWTVAGNGSPLGLVFNPKTPYPQVANFADEKIKH